jgi:hypothetical protein
MRLHSYQTRIFVAVAPPDRARDGPLVVRSHSNEILKLGSACISPTPTRDNCPRLRGLGEDETHYLTLFRSVKRFEIQEEEPCLSSQQCSNNITITHFIHCRTINRRGTNRGTPKREGRGLNHQQEKFAIVPAVG